MLYIHEIRGSRGVAAGLSVQDIFNDMINRDWEELGRQPTPSWYLDPLAARQKRQAHLDLIRKWWGGSGTEYVLKTDLFEEAFGEDRILPDIVPMAGFVCGMDESFSTTRAAALRHASGRAVVSDVRRIGFKTGAFELVISTSTLDHFTSRDDFIASLHEIHRVMQPGGLLILTLDNPWNPLYAPLRLYSRTRFAPFFLGYTPTMSTLKAVLEEVGFEVEDVDWLVHNPRLLSTALFLLCRRLMGGRADAPIAFFIRCFALLGKLPTRRWTACFQAVAARKPAGDNAQKNNGPPGA